MMNATDYENGYRDGSRNILSTDDVDSVIFDGVPADTLADILADAWTAEMEAPSSEYVRGVRAALAETIDFLIAQAQK